MFLFRVGIRCRQMQKKPFPSETQERFIVRLPDGMRDKIADAAKAAGRSMNAEIVNRLERSFSDAPAINGVGMREIFEKLAELDAAIKAGTFTPFSKKGSK